MEPVKNSEMSFTSGSHIFTFPAIGSNAPGPSTEPMPPSPPEIPAMTMAHTHHTWLQAVKALLQNIGVSQTDLDLSTPEKFSKSISAFGFTCVQSLESAIIIPNAEKQLGALIQLSNGSWYAASGSAELKSLSANGEEEQILDLKHITGLTATWVLRKNLIGLGAIKPYILRNKKYFIDLLLAAFIINSFALLLPLYSSFVYDKILGNDIFDTLWAIVIGMLIIAVIEFLVRILRIKIAEKFSVSSEADIDGATFQNLLGLSANKLPNIGALLDKYKQVLAFRDFLSSSYLMAIADIPFLFLFLAAIAFVSGPLVLIPVFCGLAYVVSSFITSEAVLIHDQKGRAASEKRFSILANMLASREAIIGGALQGHLSEKWRQSSLLSASANSSARFWRGIGQNFSNSFSFISFVFVLVAGAYMLQSGSLTSGGLLAASLLSSRTMALFGSLTSLKLRYSEFKTALRDLDQLAPTLAHFAEKSHGRLHGAVRFENVTVKLDPNAAPILEDINLTFNAGEIIGIAGAPGSGKTTFLRLLAGVLSPERGSVLIDNIPLSTLSPADITLNLGYKPQDLCLLEGTIEETVQAGRPPLTPQLRSDVLQLSGLGLAFGSSALNWASETGTRGASLSGGQRQLVALARALLGRPTILLLDEPSNGLDTQFENHIAAQMQNLRGKSTIFISSHSRNLLSICDRIIVIGQGKILANGPRQQILQ